MRRRPAVALVLPMLMLLWAPAAAADRWYEHYDRAEQAMADGDWTVAVQELNEALERKGDSVARVRSYGVNVISYFPYLKLGIAYYNLNRHDAALQAFETEMRLGEIEASADDMAELERYRALARQARDDASAAERRRIDEIVRSGMEQAAAAESEGRLQQAMDLLGRVLAVDPDNADAVAMNQRLREALARRQRAQADQQRSAELVQRGRNLFAAREYAEAASVLRQALELAPSAQARSLLDQAQAALRDALRSDDEQRRRALIADGLEQAQRLQAAARLSEALDRLQPVLALDPTNRRAAELQRQLLEAQRDAERLEAVAAELKEADELLAAGRWEASLAAANRALGLDAGNATAKQQARRAYAQISRQLLGSREIENIHPAIRFADFRQDQPDGSRVQVVRRADFRLSGVVIDNTPVQVDFAAGERALSGAVTTQEVGSFFITEFNLDEELPPGTTVIQLAATDEQGLRSGAEYAVLYRRPVHRSPWFLAGCVALPVLVGLALVALRRQQRRRLLRRRYNPFIAGAPVLEETMFFGREQLIERVLQTVHNNSLLLYGERRIGKTSLQHHLKRRLQALDDPDYAFFPVYVDLQGTPQERFFATLAEDVFHELEPHLGGLGPGDAPAAAGYGHRELVRDLRAVIALLERTTGKQVKLVLLIDEVDELNDYDPRINQKLRSLFMKSFASNLVAVVSGVKIRRQWELEGSPWYNFFEEIEVTAISPEAARALITRPIDGVFEVEEGVVDRLIERSECKPYLIQRLCVALINRMHEQGRRTITRADVEAIGGSANGNS